MSLPIYATATSKHAPFLILDILQDYTDEAHSLLLNQIVEKLEQVYGFTADRKSVKENIVRLQELGYDIVENGKGNGWYLCERTFSEYELRLLIDSVLFSKHIPQKYALDMITKLKTMGSKYMREKYRNVIMMSELSHTENAEFFLNIDILDQAISAQRQVSFIYNQYGADKHLHPKTKNPQIVNPYQLVISNGHYYLIGNRQRYANVINYRVERITDIKLLDKPVKPVTQVKEFANGIDVATYLKERPYLFGGVAENAKLRVEKDLIGDVIDWFGMDFNILEETEKDYLIRLSANIDALFYWAMQYSESVEVIEPLSIRERIKDTVKKVAERYV